MRPYLGKVLVVAAALTVTLVMAAQGSKPTITKTAINIIDSPVLPGNILPQFMFMQGAVEGATGNVALGGGRGTPRPFNPDDSNGPDIFEGGMEDMRSPQLPYLTQDQWTCDRKPAQLPVVQVENEFLKMNVVPSINGKIWNLFDKKNNREMFFNNPAHQPANIGALKAWASGGCEWNWSPGIIGHSAFSESPVWVARVQSDRGDVVRVYEFDRYNMTVWQVDMLIEDDVLWVHPRIINPTPVDLRGYWWTCVAHHVTPASRVISPATHVAETSSGPIRDAPWPFMAETLNTSFSGLPPDYIWRQDHSYLGNIIWGDFFLRIPDELDKYIMHVEEDGYSVYHGHTLNGTKFFTWGQSGPGRFMQDFLSANAPDRAGDYAELQVGPAPTQMQTWPLPKNSKFEWTEFFKAWMPDAKTISRLRGRDYDDALRATDSLINGPNGVSKQKFVEMDTFMKSIASKEVKPGDIISQGMPWGALNEMLRAWYNEPTPRMTPSAYFSLNAGDWEVRPWFELLQGGTFSAETLKRLPISFQVHDLWRKVITDSANKYGMTWLHALHLGIIAMENGFVAEARALFEQSNKLKANPVAYRNLALLTKTADDAYPYFMKAWNMAVNNQEEPSRDRLVMNLAAEIAMFLQTQSDPKWRAVLADFIINRLDKAPNIPDRAKRTDQIITSRIYVAIYVTRDFDYAISMLKSECFPTYGKGRKDLINFWNDAHILKEAQRIGRPLTRLEQRNVRVNNFPPRNIGCPYADTYCPNYW